MSSTRRRALFSIIVVTIVLTTPEETSALPLTFTIDSSALAGLPAQLAFDLIDGTAASDSRVAIRDFSTDGVLGLSSAVGGVTGSLSGDVAMSDAGFFNEFLQALTLGTSLTFTVDATMHGAGVIPDEWSLLVLDAAGTAPLVHTDLLGDALILLEFDGTPGGRLWTATRTTPVVLLA